MRLPGEPPVPLTQRVRGLLAGLGCSRAECVALAVLASGALVALGLLWLLARPPTEGDNAGPAAPTGVAVTDAELVVHVAGEVARPGLYRLPAGARVADALDEAGGPLPSAQLAALNLARPLSDGEQLFVAGAAAVLPGATDAPDASGGSAAPSVPSAVRPDGRLDLNLATIHDLDELPGIGPVLAERILAHREEIGRFSDVGQLRDVAGIGEKTFQDLADLVVV